MKLGSKKVGKVTDPELWKHFWTGREGPKRSKNDPKMSVLGGFERKSNLFLCTIFNSVWKWEQCYIYLPKLLVCKKSSFWVMVQSRPIRIQDSLNCNMSETSWGMKLTFCSWISIHRNNRYRWTHICHHFWHAQPFLCSGRAGHVKSGDKYWAALSPV